MLKDLRKLLARKDKQLVQFFAHLYKPSATTTKTQRRAAFEGIMQRLGKKMPLIEPLIVRLSCVLISAAVLDELVHVLDSADDEQTWDMVLRFLASISKTRAKLFAGKISAILDAVSAARGSSVLVALKLLVTAITASDDHARAEREDKGTPSIKFNQKLIVFCTDNWPGARPCNFF